jgi:TPR repeat protein
MMRRSLAIVATLGCCLISRVQAAGYDAGLKAMQQGQYAKAFKAWKPLAESGKTEVQAAIAVMYHTGRGVDQDYHQALNWYRKAAEKGNAAAQANLGVMYAKGVGTQADEVMAYVWYDLAAAKGLGNRVVGRDQVAKVLSKAELSKAQQLSREYAKKYVDPYR